MSEPPLDQPIARVEYPRVPVPVLYNDKGYPVCGARRKKCRKCGYRYPGGDPTDICPQCGEGRRCQQVVTKEGRRCNMHGGMSLRGIASPKWRDGRHSKYLPEGLVSRYQRAMSDKELLRLRDDIALLDTRISSLLQRAGAGEAGRIWREALAEFKAFRQASARADPAEIRVHLNSLDELLRTGAGEAAAWDEIQRAIEQRRKLVDTEMRRLEKLQQFITAEQAQHLLIAVAEAIRRNVTDIQVLDAVARELDAIMAGGIIPRTEADGLPSLSDMADPGEVSE